MLGPFSGPQNGITLIEEIRTLRITTPLVTFRGPENGPISGVTNSAVTFPKNPPGASPPDRHTPAKSTDPECNFLDGYGEGACESECVEPKRGAIHFTPTSISSPPKLRRENFR